MPSRFRRAAYAVFRALPRGLRKRMVRLGTPNYTVGAVVLLRDEADRLLLLRQPPGPGWSLPGGLLGRLERPVDAAVRELAEETGVVVRPEDLRAGVPSAVVNSGTQQVDCVFTSTVDSVEFRSDVDPVEVFEGRWFALDRLPALTTPTARLLRACGLTPAPDGS
jgi:8-oxo-dGTP pyrophosphatase MutT (NUDIX family)